MNSSNSDQPKPPGKRSRGAILKEARKAQGLSLDKIHDETKIPLDVLKAIEEGYTVRTLSPFYFKGFVKMYAQYLEVDPARVIDDYHKEELPPAIEETPKKEERRPLQEPKIELPVWDIQEFFTPRRKEFLVKGIAVLFVLFLVTRIFGCVKDRAKNKTVKSATAVEKVEEKSQKTEVAKPPAQQEARIPSPRLQRDDETGELVRRADAPASPGSAAVPQQEEGVRLTVKVKRQGWLQVKADGSVVFQSTLNEGTTETWKAEESIELSGKLIHYLDYTVNGKDVGGLSRDARNARRLVVTEKGISPK